MKREKSLLLKPIIEGYFENVVFAEYDRKRVEKDLLKLITGHVEKPQVNFMEQTLSGAIAGTVIYSDDDGEIVALNVDIVPSGTFLKEEEQKMAL